MGGSNRAAAKLGLVGHEVAGELQYVICHLAFQHSVQLSLISSAFQFAKFDFKL